MALLSDVLICPLKEKYLEDLQLYREVLSFIIVFQRNKCVSFREELDFTSQGLKYIFCSRQISSLEN